MIKAQGGTSAQRWPPYVALGAGLVMVFMLFPNPLRNPQNNPTASAEYAPIPGRQDSAQNANFGETDLASSGGIGAGGQGFGLLPGSGLIKPPAEFVPSQKHCIGDPPRQTEDPLSPPCVPYFNADNGGATWQGVTKDEIKIVYYNDDDVEGDLNAKWQPSDENAAGTPRYYYEHLVRTVKAHLRYFQARFQTYGRRVRLIGHSSDLGRGTRGPQRKGDALEIAFDIKPFAAAILIENAQDFSPLAAEYEIPSFGWNEDAPLEAYTRSAPYFWSFMPDQATETKWAASFLCRKLSADERGRYGRGTAKFTTDPDLLGRERSFGLIYERASASERGPFLEQLATQLQAEVRKQCDLTFALVRPINNRNDSASVMSAFKQAKITTVVCYCTPQQTELHVPAFQSAATSLNYFPEWYWDHASAMDRALWQRTYGNPSHQGIGVSFLWRQPAFNQSYAYRAYQSVEPGTAPNLRFNFEIYHVFLNLFSGIQAAGPNLTPETLEKGMFTFGYTNPDNPWLPTGGYGSYGPSPYTFIHTAMAFWYDPQGTPPGGKKGEGCIKVVNDGRRSYGDPTAGRPWSFGDQDIKPPDKDWPCTEDERREVGA